jgi:hypothetical protein
MSRCHITPSHIPLARATQSDKDILEHIVYDLNDQEMMDGMRASIDEAQPIQQQQQALDYIGKRASQVCLCWQCACVAMCVCVAVCVCVCARAPASCMWPPCAPAATTYTTHWHTHHASPPPKHTHTNTHSCSGRREQGQAH